MRPDYVGNDVIDLDDPAIADHHRRDALVARVCAPEELHALARAADPKLRLWCLFAAKEAAFKVTVKRFGEVPFAHRAFVVEPDLCAVRYGQLRFPLLLSTGPGWVHAVVSNAARPVFRVSASTNASASSSVRELLVVLVAAETGWPAESLCVERAPSPRSWDGYGPPRLLHEGRPAAFDVSLSHDGRFVAAAAVALRGDNLGASKIRPGPSPCDS